MADWPYNTAHWRRLRTLKLSMTPFCEYGRPGCTRTATQVDHKTAIKAGGHPFDLGNLASTCARCHSMKTNEHDGGAFKRTRPDVDPATGLPLNRHWWAGVEPGKSLQADEPRSPLPAERRVSSTRGRC